MQTELEMREAGLASEPPELTLPSAEATLVQRSFETAQTILEYGSGGSTVLAGDLEGRTVFSVESDMNWAERMRGWFRRNPPAATVHLHAVDIGPTKEWGMPVGHARFRDWPAYALSVWDRPDFRQPDVVLIDGRFRPACLLTAMFRSTGPVRVLFDDYAHRKAYHAVESFAKPVEVVGRMARFELEPAMFPVARMAEIFGHFLRPR